MIFVFHGQRTPPTSSNPFFEPEEALFELPPTCRNEFGVTSSL
jgi:hypothetical protein